MQKLQLIRNYEEYRATQYAEGYFDYKDGLGDVYYNETDLVEEIIAIHGKKLKEKYKKKINEFFVYQDEHNCDRNYEEIKKTLGRK